MKEIVEFVLEVGAGVVVGCLVAGAAFWLYVTKKRRLNAVADEPPVHLGRDLKQAAIVGREQRTKSAELEARRNSTETPTDQDDGKDETPKPKFKFKGGFLNFIGSPQKVDPTTDVYIPSTRRIVSPQSGKPATPQTVATPRIYVLPISPSDSPAASPMQPHSKAHGKKQNDELGKVDRIPSRSILDDPTVREIGGEGNNVDTQEGSDFQDVDTCLNADATTVDIDETPAASLNRNFCLESSSVCTSVPGLDIEVVDSEIDEVVASLKQPAPAEKTLTCMLSLVMEEVLPRPESGLLKRMLRMAEVPMSKVEGCKEPIFNFRVASECHFSVGMIVVQDNNTGIEISGPVRISMQPTDGDRVDLEVNSEQIDSDEHLTTSFWDLKNHSSELMTTMPATSPGSTSLIPIELILGFNVKVTTKDEESVHEVGVRKTLLAKIRRGSAMDVEPRYHYSEEVVEFVLCELELIAMPSLLMFMRLSV